jgi:hypothetical protein
VAAIKKKGSARVMHAPRLAYVGSRGAKDMLALEDLPKLSPSDWEFCNFFGPPKSQALAVAGSARRCFRRSSLEGYSKLTTSSD